MDKYQEYLEIMNLNQNYSIDELKISYKNLIKNIILINMKGMN